MISSAIKSLRSNTYITMENLVSGTHTPQGFPLPRGLDPPLGGHYHQPHSPEKAAKAQRGKATGPTSPREGMLRARNALAIFIVVSPTDTSLPHQGQCSIFH